MAPLNVNDVILQRLSELHEDVKGVREDMKPLISLPTDVMELRTKVESHEKTLSRVRGGAAVVGAVATFLGWDTFKHLFLKP